MAHKHNGWPMCYGMMVCLLHDVLEGSMLGKRTRGRRRIRLPAPDFGTVYHHISEIIQSVLAVTKDIFVWIVRHSTVWTTMIALPRNNLTYLPLIDNLLEESRRFEENSWRQEHFENDKKRLIKLFGISSGLSWFIFPWSLCMILKPNTYRRRRRDETVESRRVGVGGVYMNSQLAHDDCRRIRSTIWKLAKQTVSVSVSMSWLCEFW